MVSGVYFSNIIIIIMLIMINILYIRDSTRKMNNKKFRKKKIKAKNYVPAVCDTPNEKENQNTSAFGVAKQKNNMRERERMSIHTQFKQD